MWIPIRAIADAIKLQSIVDEWCEGFLRGVNLWDTLTAADATQEAFAPFIDN